MRIDGPTLFLVLILLTLLLGLLLRWAWRASQSAAALERWGTAYLVTAVSVGLFVGRGHWPDFVTIDLANAGILAGYALMWSSIRIFNGRSPVLRFGLLPVILWLVLCRLPAIHEAIIARVGLFSVLSAALSLTIAQEFLRRSDFWMQRLSAFLLVCGNGVFFLVRAAFIASAEAPMQTWDDVWFPLTGVEAIIYVVTSAFLLLSLAMARLAGEHRLNSEQDYLTGATNRRGFEAQGSALFQQAQRAGQTSAVVLFDLDRFKRINDTFGHHMGDCVLAQFGSAAREELRRTDLLCRLGGDEFVALLFDVDDAQADKIANRIATRFSELCKRLKGLEALGCAVSLGIAVSPHSEGRLDDFVELADRALYRQKHAHHRDPDAQRAPVATAR
jgi:diguanylate cyclase (GGDEF)-like protein